jgi:hypothetical protein
MKTAQRILVERALEFIGYVLYVFLVMMFLTGVAYKELRFVGDILGSRNVIVVVWMTVILFAACVWLWGFLQADLKMAIRKLVVLDDELHV